MPWSLSERLCSASDAGVGVDASDAAADSSGGVAAASEGLETFHVGSQDMGERDVGERRIRKDPTQLTVSQSHLNQ